MWDVVVVFVSVVVDTPHTDFFFFDVRSVSLCHLLHLSQIISAMRLCSCACVYTVHVSREQRFCFSLFRMHLNRFQQHIQYSMDFFFFLSNLIFFFRFFFLFNATDHTAREILYSFRIEVCGRVNAIDWWVQRTVSVWLSRFQFVVLEMGIQWTYTVN